MSEDTTLLHTGDLSLDQEAWDRLAYFSYRPELFFDSWATVKPTNQTQPGSQVTFTKFDDLDVATDSLDERTDVDAVTFGDSQITVTIEEYGNVVKNTRFLQATSYIPIDPVVANVLGYNAGESIDSIVRDILYADSNSGFGDINITRVAEDGDRDDTTPDDTLEAKHVRRARAALRRRHVPTFNGHYAAAIHPDVSVDLREETGAAAWRDPQVYGTSQGRIWNGEIGIFEGVRFIETPRAKVWEGEGAGAEDSEADVYGTLFVGQQALAKAVPVVAGFGDQPRIVPGPVTDHLRRFVPLGWYHVVGYGRFREDSMERVESGSSLDEDYSD